MFKLRVCSFDKMTPIHFLRLEFRSHYITGQWSELIKTCYLMLFKFALFFVLHHKICVFIIFISFFDELSNFCNRILTNQKRKLVVSNCQWNFMLIMGVQIGTKQNVNGK